MKYHDLIYSAIKTGEENAVHLAELVQLSGLSERDTRRVIEMLRQRGAVICADEKGYYKPASLHELERYERQESARSRSIYRRTASARKLLKKWREQKEFEGASLLGKAVNNGK